MYSQSRSAKVFAAALLSILIGVVILKSLGNNPPPAGAFSLSEYYHLGPIEEIISSVPSRSCKNWNRIEISYSPAKPIELAKQATHNHITNYNYHFIVWNGLVETDGQIQSTDKWERQIATIPRRNTYGSEQTIRIAVIIDSNATYPTNLQIKKAEALAEALSRKFEIQPAFIYYPDNWW